MNSTVEMFSFEEIQANHAVFRERSELYKKNGLDQEMVRENIMRQISDNSRSILEIGTGMGHLTTMLAHRFDRVVSIDVDGDCQRIAKLNAVHYGVLRNIEFIVSDAGKLAFPDCSFDAVVSAYAFHHFDFPFRVVREMARIAKNQVVISDFNRKGFAVIEKLLSLEGRTHERKSGDFSIVGVFLKELNFNVRTTIDDWQILYSAFRKDSTDFARSDKGPAGTIL